MSKTAPAAQATSATSTCFSGLPANEDAERVILGSVLLDETNWLAVERLQPEDFSIERHRRLFRCMRALARRSRPIDRVTVAEEMNRSSEREPDTLTYLLDLDYGLPMVPHLQTYVESVLQEEQGEGSNPWNAEGNKRTDARC